MPKTARKQYAQSSMQNAFDDVQLLGISTRAAAKKHGVPKSTLFGKVKKYQPVNAKMGPTTILSPEEEKHLVKWIFHLAATGFPINKDQLLDSVKLLMDKMKRSTPFTDNRPGRHWYEGFLRRHPELSIRVAQNLTYTRASATEGKLRNWFSEVSAYLESKNLLNIDSSRIFNCDETAFLLCPKADNVLVRKGSKSVYKIVDGDEKECLTTLFMVNGAGTLLPPLVMYWYQRIPSSVSRNFPSDWSIGTSEKGWMTAETFYEYVTNVFYPWLLQNDIQFPIILFVDGHSSHCTYPLSKFCRKVQIELIALFPNATHILQPLDVAVFHPMKSAWKKTVTSWRIDNGGIRLRKEMFAPVLKKAIESLDLTETIKNGFKSCGLYPFTADAVDFNILQKGLRKSQVCPTSESEEAETTTQTDTSNYVHFIEQGLSANLLSAFKNSEGSGRWTGDVTQRGLFDFWLQTKKCAGKEKRGETSIQFLAPVHEQIRQQNASAEEMSADTQNILICMDVDSQDITTSNIEMAIDFDERGFLIDDLGGFEAANIDHITTVDNRSTGFSFTAENRVLLSNDIQFKDFQELGATVEEDHTVDRISSDIMMGISAGVASNDAATEKIGTVGTEVHAEAVAGNGAERSIDIVADERRQAVVEKGVDLVADICGEASSANGDSADLVTERSVDVVVGVHVEAIAEKSVDIEAENSTDLVAERSIVVIAECIEAISEASVNAVAEESVEEVTKKSVDVVDEESMYGVVEETGNIVNENTGDGVFENSAGTTEASIDNNPEGIDNRSRNRIPDNIPQTFKEALFWPPDMENQKRKKLKNGKPKVVKKVPTVATSNAWIEYHDSQKREQERLEREKVQRQKKRQEMQAEQKRFQEEKKIIREEKKKEQAEKKRKEAEEKQRRQAERKLLQDKKKQFQEKIKTLHTKVTKNKKQ